MACLENFANGSHLIKQIDTRVSSNTSNIITHQCGLCGFIDNNIPDEKHTHSETNMEFKGQYSGYYVLICGESNCNHQIRIQIV